jgi:hypothetical protein
MPLSSGSTNSILRLLHAENEEISTYQPTGNNPAEGLDLHVYFPYCGFLCFLLLVIAGANCTDCIGQHLTLLVTAKEMYLKLNEYNSFNLICIDWCSAVGNCRWHIKYYLENM